MPEVKWEDINTGILSTKSVEGLKNADYIYNNCIIADEVNTTKSYCKKAQVGVDLTIKNIYKIKKAGFVAKDKSYVPEYKLIPFDDQSYGGKEFIGWKLKKGTYIVELNEGLQFGSNDTGYIIMRSSLNRSGVTIQSAVWDPGFTTQEGDIINTPTVRLTVDTRKFYVERDARIAQLIVWPNEDTYLYDGQYQGGKKKSKLLLEGE